MTSILVLLLGGSGSRFGGNLPKQFQEFKKGEPLFAVTVRRFCAAQVINEVLLTVHPDYLDAAIFADAVKRLRDDFSGIHFRSTAGGASRHESFRRSVDFLKDKPAETILWVQDANRPRLRADFLRRAAEAASFVDEKTPCFVPVIPEVNSVVELTKDQTVSAYLQRERVHIVQTPQILHLGKAREALAALNAPGDYTDEGSLMLATGNKVSTFEGDSENQKITYREDMENV